MSEQLQTAKEQAKALLDEARQNRLARRVRRSTEKFDGFGAVYYLVKEILTLCPEDYPMDWPDSSILSDPRLDSSYRAWIKDLRSREIEPANFFVDLALCILPINLACGNAHDRMFIVDFNRYYGNRVVVETLLRGVIRIIACRDLARNTITAMYNDKRFEAILAKRDPDHYLTGGLNDEAD